MWRVLPRHPDRAKIDAAGGTDAFAALTGEALDQVLISAAGQSFETVALIPAALVVLFGAVWLYDIRSKPAGNAGEARQEG